MPINTIFKISIFMYMMSNILASTREQHKTTHSSVTFGHLWDQVKIKISIKTKINYYNEWKTNNTLQSIISSTIFY